MNPLFTAQDATIGDIHFVALKQDEHIPHIHQWVTQSYAEFWGMQHYSPLQVFEFYKNLMDSTVGDVFVGLVQGQPSFLVETYDPKQEEVGHHYQPEGGDIGMHILIAPAETPISGFTFAIFKAVMLFLFQTPQVKRVVVEPDHSNHKIHALNKRAGFQHIKRITLKEKIANLAFCTETQFKTTLKLQDDSAHKPMSPELAVSAITPETWKKVNRLHIKKCLAELSHERLLRPELLRTELLRTELITCEVNSRVDGPIGHQEQWKMYQVSADTDGTVYQFKAQTLQLEHWLIDADSICKTHNGQPATLDSVSFILEFSKTLAIPEKLLPTYLEEITSTLYSAAFKEEKPWLSAEQLLSADFQQVEAAMSEGHPAFIANNGRIGFNAQDFRDYAPESGQPIALIWLAAHQSQADFTCCDDISYQTWISQEIDITSQEAFNDNIKAKGVNPDEYVLIPVHPWQWFNKLAHIFAPDIAANNLIVLGESDDKYQAQQSIRTFFNLSNPTKFYVKTALSVLNMGFMRGLSAYYMRTTPAINDWVNQLVTKDTYLQDKGFIVLREIAAVGYRNDYYEHPSLKDNPYKKMLAALWRESPLPLLKPKQRLMTMASLLHIDPNNDALLVNLIQASGLSTQDWLTQYFDAYLSPLLHCYYKHGLVFMPHGENLILVFEDHVPVRAIMKDIGEEICLLNSTAKLPEKVQRIAVKVPENEETLAILTDVFDCFFRYMSAILVEHSQFPEDEFWRLVAECIQRYHTAHPEFATKFLQHDLFADTFAHSCLNRLQLANNQQMVDLADPASSLQFAGRLKNPIGQYSPKGAKTTLERSLTAPSNEQAEMQSLTD